MLSLRVSFISQDFFDAAGFGQTGPSPIIPPLYEIVQKLELHQTAIAKSPHEPNTWSAVWTLPQATTPTASKLSKVPVLFGLVNMTEEELDVQEACDAGESISQLCTHCADAAFEL